MKTLNNPSLLSLTCCVWTAAQGRPRSLAATGSTKERNMIMKLTYHWEGDYRIPDLLPTQEE
ncbi:MAG: hypothetical protein RRY64_10020, partial [Oscillospiraceae bacterium]